MVAYRTKEEYEARKAQQLKEVKENCKEQPRAHFESASDSKSPSQTRMMFSDVLPLLLLGGLAAVFVFSILSPVLTGPLK